MDTPQKDLIIIGAGPYGLGAAAQAKQSGLDYLLIGEPMQFWKTAMPPFMVLRSPQRASSLYSPTPGLSLTDFCRSIGHTINPREKTPLKTFLDYCDWFVERADLNHLVQTVTRLETLHDGRFSVTTSAGEQLSAKTIIVATGNAPFADIPEVFRSLDPHRCAHTSAITDFSAFSGRRVLVVGAGQSAADACLGLVRAGATVSLCHHQDGLYWHDVPLRIAVPALILIATFPTLLEFLPPRWRERFAERISAPTVNTSFQALISPYVTEFSRAHVSRASETESGVVVDFADGRQITVDHVVLGTGYRVELAHLQLLAPDLVTCISLRNGYPVLDRHLQASVPGLYFTGIMAKGRFGPPFGFLFACAAASRRIIRGVKRHLAAHA